MRWGRMEAFLVACFPNGFAEMAAKCWGRSWSFPPFSRGEATLIHQAVCGDLAGPTTDRRKER